MHHIWWSNMFFSSGPNITARVNYMSSDRASSIEARIRVHIVRAAHCRSSLGVGMLIKQNWKGVTVPYHIFDPCCSCTPWFWEACAITSRGYIEHEKRREKRREEKTREEEEEEEEERKRKRRGRGENGRGGGEDMHIYLVWIAMIA